MAENKLPSGHTRIDTLEMKKTSLLTPTMPMRIQDSQKFLSLLADMKKPSDW